MAQVCVCDAKRDNDLQPLMCSSGYWSTLAAYVEAIYGSKDITGEPIPFFSSDIGVFK